MFFGLRHHRGAKESNSPRDEVSLRRLLQPYKTSGQYVKPKGTGRANCTDLLLLYQEADFTYGTSRRAKET